MQTVTITTDTQIVSGRIKESEFELLRREVFKQRTTRSKFVAKAIRFYLKHLSEGATNNEPS